MYIDIDNWKKDLIKRLTRLLDGNKVSYTKEFVKIDNDFGACKHARFNINESFTRETYLLLKLIASWMEEGSVW